MPDDLLHVWNGRSISWSSDGSTSITYPSSATTDTRYVEPIKASSSWDEIGDIIPSEIIREVLPQITRSMSRPQRDTILHLTQVPITKATVLAWLSRYREDTSITDGNIFYSYIHMLHTILNQSTKERTMLAERAKNIRAYLKSIGALEERPSTFYARDKYEVYGDFFGNELLATATTDWVEIRVESERTESYHYIKKDQINEVLDFLNTFGEGEILNLEVLKHFRHYNLLYVKTWESYRCLVSSYVLHSRLGTDTVRLPENTKDMPWGSLFVNVSEVPDNSSIYRVRQCDLGYNVIDGTIRFARGTGRGLGSALSYPNRTNKWHELKEKYFIPPDGSSTQAEDAQDIYIPGRLTSKFAQDLQEYKANKDGKQTTPTETIEFVEFEDRPEGLDLTNGRGFLKFLATHYHERVDNPTATFKFSVPNLYSKVTPSKYKGVTTVINNVVGFVRWDQLMNLPEDYVPVWRLHQGYLGYMRKSIEVDKMCSLIPVSIMHKDEVPYPETNGFYFEDCTGGLPQVDALSRYRTLWEDWDTSKANMDRYGFACDVYNSGDEDRSNSTFVFTPYSPEEGTSAWTRRKVWNYSRNPVTFFGLMPYGPYNVAEGEGDPTFNMPYYGVELEVSCHKVTLDDALERTMSALPVRSALCKSDSSIQGMGYEIVSAPGTINWHRQIWREFFKSSRKYLRSWDMESNGLHIHVSRMCMSRDEQDAFTFFFDNSKNIKFIQTVAGRSLHRWATPYFKDDASENGSNGKYQACNITKTNTLEVRIFRGTVHPAGFFKALEFVDALRQYVVESDVSNTVNITSNMVFSKFLEWITTKQTDYPVFFKWLQHRKFLNPNGAVNVEKSTKFLHEVDVALGRHGDRSPLPARVKLPDEYRNLVDKFARNIFSLSHSHIHSKIKQYAMSCGVEFTFEDIEFHGNGTNFDWFKSAILGLNSAYSKSNPPNGVETCWMLFDPLDNFKPHVFCYDLYTEEAACVDPKFRELFFHYRGVDKAMPRMSNKKDSLLPLIEDTIEDFTEETKSAFN